ncbi:uncharacterized protein LOC125039543 isoform X4 [Penaeus chinensis]|uniref:uncharacterized protein LOC125039543 isoform X4 n=1 Tax=Penaeus chinensis TaxID=139456 RepID=UPI001FB820BE|nr:uncharacterized protein LOC125039543 isoform X4 [Penaeus chinensis]
MWLRCGSSYFPCGSPGDVTAGRQLPSRNVRERLCSRFVRTLPSIAGEMSPVSRGSQGLLLLATLVLLQAGQRGAEAASVPPADTDPSPSPPKPKTQNDIEEFVKKLEYEAQGGIDNSLDGFVDVVDFNLLSDVVADDVQAGLDEEFAVVDSELGEKAAVPANKTSDPSRSRQLSLIYQGVYAPDARFNAFADGVMVNMVAEMKRKRMDPLYFRVYDRGVVEHVSTQSTRGGRRDEPSAVSSSFADASSDTSQSSSRSNSRRGRQSGNAIGGGVIRGLTNVRRFGNAEVQVAGNTTLVRGHWLTGPLDLIIDYRGSPGITRVRTGIQAVQFDTLTTVDRYGAEMAEYQLISPLFDFMPYYGNRTLAQQRTTELVVRHLFSNASFMSLLMRDAFEIASYDKIIPQFGTEANYYTVLKYLFNNGPGASSRSPPAARGVSLPGVPSAIAEYLAGVARQAKSTLETLG